MNFNNDEVVLFGTAPMGSKIFREISKYASVKCFLDNDVAKQGTLHEGIPVLSPEELAGTGFNGLIIITNRDYIPVESQLRALGFLHIIVYGAQEQPHDFSMKRTLYLSQEPRPNAGQETVFRKNSPWSFTLKHMESKYEQSADLSKRKKSEVMLLGDYTNDNIGGQLTVLAAYKIIEALGYSIKIARFESHLANSPKRKAIWEHLCSFSENVVAVESSQKMEKLNDEAISFVTCSDWTFNKTFSEGWNLFTQPFVDDSKLRIAFAASFGRSGGGYEESDYGELKRRLSRFTDLGLRESSGIEFCSTIGVENAVLMHDPVFCFDRDFYEKLSELDEIDRPLTKTLVNGKYAVVYLKSHTENNIKLCSDIAEHLGLELLVFIVFPRQKPAITHFKFEERGIKFLTDVTMCEWLYFMNSSELVLTDSFHATCFSLIFNKVFLAIKHVDETPKLSRMSTLMSRAGLMERLVDAHHELPAINDILSIPPINWHDINIKLTEWKSRSIDFIDKALMK